ncbi:MAG: winged helix-turn-helix transcriptional regulator [Mariprofundus sp.]|nr:winged helix-turn-helix transcriptional regulator [Mariprofundus sp.]
MDIAKEHIQQASEGLKALAHETRLSIVCHLTAGELCVGELIALTEASQSNLSQHLAKMKGLGVIGSEKRGQHVYYRLADSKWGDVVRALQAMYCPKILSQGED